MPATSNCCHTLFGGFAFTDFRAAEPPPQRGVYVIRVMQRGDPVPTIIEQVQRLTERVGWPMLTRTVLNRVERLRRIAECETINIGSAGTYAGSNNTLLGRYGEFGGRHTIMYPLWSLLGFGWKLDYGWMTAPDAAHLESELKQRYRQTHDNRLPALVHR